MLSPMSPTWDLILTVLASPKNGTLIQVIWNYLVSTTCNSVPKGSETQVPEKARRVWTSSGSWWWTGKPNVLAESDTTDWATERTDWWLIRVGIQQKPTQYCKAIILQLKLIHFLKKKKKKDTPVGFEDGREPLGCGQPLETGTDWK